MNHKVRGQDLIVGKRYWLDGAKDESAEYAGLDDGCVSFINPEPSITGYIVRKTKFGESITFGEPTNSNMEFYEIL